MRRILLASSLVAAVALSACAANTGSEGDEGQTAESEGALSTFGKTFIGDWDRRAGEVGPFDHLVLKADGSFFAETQVMCVRAPCPPVRETGRWSAKAYVTGGTTGLITLFPKQSSPMKLDVSRAQDGSEMKVREASASGKVDPKAPVGHYAYALNFCDADVDCAGQQVRALGLMCMVGTSYKTVCATDVNACATKCLP